MYFSRILLLFLLFSASHAGAQTPDAKRWADSVYRSLSADQRIAQLMVVRLSTIDQSTNTVTFFDEKVKDLIKKYNIGGICVFQGSPTKQALIINELQRMAKTPLLMCIDAEWGVGMRLIDSVLPLPKQIMLGAMKDETIVYHYGQLVAQQCKRMGIQVNYAPVVDVNNNPKNPVINDRSFGEDKYKVAAYGIQYIKGMQDLGVMACAKHFPGHGDVETDSHYDLPVINKSMAQLDSLELYPFRQVFAAGVGSVMVAHLFIPAIDNTPNRASSLSPKNINELMRGKLNYQGLAFTDALEMQGVKKFFPNGAASVQSLIAGNDMLCLPEDVPSSIQKIKAAIKSKSLSWRDIEMHAKKVLAAKYTYGLSKVPQINIENLTADLNRDVAAMRRLVAENALTLAIKKDETFFPLRDTKPGNVAFVGIGLSAENNFATRLRADYNATVFLVDKNAKFDDTLLAKLKNFKKVVIGIHGLGRSPANNFLLSKDNIDLVNAIDKQNNSVSFIFGNAYAAKSFCNNANVVVCYEDDPIIRETAADMLKGNLFYKGVLPVTVCPSLPFGTGIETKAPAPLFEKSGAYLFDQIKFWQADSIAADAIEKRATPGLVLLALKDGRIAYEKAYGHFMYDNPEPVTLNSVYDLASITKIAATNLAVMKLYEEGKLSLDETLSTYLTETANTDKGSIRIEDLLLHRAGLQPFIPFYKETLDNSGKPLFNLYSSQQSDSFNVEVAQRLFMRTSFKDTLFARVLASRLEKKGKYVYSDNDFILLGKVVERISGLSLDEYVNRNFYQPMKLTSIGFLPMERNPLQNIAPEEQETAFRNQLLRGYVHDPGAALFGGIAGHAGLFSNAYDLAAVMQMLLNGGTFNGNQYFKKETVDLFTAYHDMNSRRGYGFDKPERNNKTEKTPYPSSTASLSTFGHTGFTGTAAWADPKTGIVFIFLSNRVYPSGSDRLVKMNVRGKMMDAVYKAMGVGI